MKFDEDNRDKELDNAFNKFYEENTFLHGYNKSVLFHAYKSAWNNRQEEIEKLLVIKHEKIDKLFQELIFYKTALGEVTVTIQGNKE